jgi:hypothetical protein
MRKSVSADWPEAALARIVSALGQELLDASDEEILAAAKDLGMNPGMKGSAAFLGLKYLRHAPPEWWLEGFDAALLARLGMPGREPSELGPVPSLTAPRRSRRPGQKKDRNHE